MNESATNVLKKLWNANSFSPRGMILRAGIVVLIFAVCELAGLREHTTFLSGTAAGAEGGGNSSVILGVIYLAAYFACVLLAPVLLLASAVLALMQRWAFHAEVKTDPKSRRYESQS